jgi:hypothetical protein
MVIIIVFVHDIIASQDCEFGFLQDASELSVARIRQIDRT